MSAKYQIDDIDRKILSHLVKNARIPFLEIARECGISGAAIHQRVKKMEDSGIIEGSRFKVIEGAPQVEVSASAIRRDIALGRSVKALVPPAVLSYMEKNGLYR